MDGRRVSCRGHVMTPTSYCRPFYIASTVFGCTSKLTRSSYDGRPAISTPFLRGSLLSDSAVTAFCLLPPAEAFVSRTGVGLQLRNIPQTIPRHWALPVPC